ncbi:MAG: PQQ-dependent catabolism-associated CXXCW motif protein [Hyphomicrobiaceae bacterium]
MVAIACILAAGGTLAVRIWSPHKVQPTEASKAASTAQIENKENSSEPDAAQSTPEPSGGEVTRIGHEKGDPSVAEPTDYRMSDYRRPVPTTLKGARVISTEEAEDLYGAKEAVFLDVYPSPPKPANLPKGTIWREPRNKTIKGALWMPNVGYGKLSVGVESYFRDGLKLVTGNDLTKPVVFFCLRDCWMSWNAAKRAMEWGYTNVIWFPEGVDGWQEFNNETEKITAMKLPG